MSTLTLMNEINSGRHDWLAGLTESQAVSAYTTARTYSRGDFLSIREAVLLRCCNPPKGGGGGGGGGGGLGGGPYTPIPNPPQFPDRPPGLPAPPDVPKLPPGGLPGPTPPIVPDKPAPDDDPEPDPSKETDPLIRLKKAICSQNLGTAVSMLTIIAAWAKAGGYDNVATWAGGFMTALSIIQGICNSSTPMKGVDYRGWVNFPVDLDMVRDLMGEDDQDMSDSLEPLRDAVVAHGGGLIAAGNPGWYNFPVEAYQNAKPGGDNDPQVDNPPPINTNPGVDPLGPEANVIAGQLINLAMGAMDQLQPK